MVEMFGSDNVYRIVEDEYSYFYNASASVFCEANNPEDRVYSIKDSCYRSLDEIEAAIGPL